MTRTNSHKNSPFSIPERARKIGLLSLLALGITTSTLAQQSYTFTPCGASGQFGPTQAMVTAGYALTNLAGNVSIVTQGIQVWTVPTTGLWRIEAWGAQGGNSTVAGGLGAKMSGEFNFTAGQVLNIMVGQQGLGAVGNAAGGGGGSFVSLGGVPQVVAGGGSGGNLAVAGLGAGTTAPGNPGQNCANAGITGFGGGDASACGSGAGGAGGFYGNGLSGGGWGSQFGYGYVNGGMGGTSATGNSHGGFGGGAGTHSNNTGGGGGGGYTGGGASYHSSSYVGGAGSSYNLGTNQANVANINSGAGKVVITALCNINLTASTPNPTLPLICSGQSLTLSTNAISNYNWNTGANTPSLVVSPTITTSYTLTATSPSNCIASSTITVVVDNTPTVTATPASTAVCAGKPVTLTGSGATTYTWTGPMPVSNGVSFIPASTANYTVTGGNACGTSSAVTSITVNPLPNIGGAANNPTVCFGTQVTLNGIGSAGGYTWSAGVTNNSAFTPPVGINDYTVTGSGANTCTNTAVVTVTVLQTPTVSPISTPTAICVGKTATLSATGGVSGYTWSPIASNLSTLAVSPVVTSTYSVLRANGSCTSIATVTVVVNPLPNLLVQAPNPPTICAGTCATVTGQGAITYTWFPGGFQGGVITVCPNSSTNYTVVASNANCTTSATSSVTVLPNPVLSIQASTTTPCAGSQITMTVTGASTYTWTSPIPVPQQNLNTVTDNPFAPVQYNVSGTDANGCTSTMNQVILPQAAPNLTTYIVNTGSFICAGQTGTLVAQGTGQINYNWLPNGASTAINTVNPPVSTVYTVTGINPSTGCMSSATLSLAVYISTFVATSNPTAVCKGNTATLSVAGAANNYTWTAGSPNNNDSIFVSPQSNITYYVTGITGNCSTTQSINMIVNPIPPVTGVAQKITICRFEPGVLVGSGAGANGTYSWTGGPGASTQNYTVFPTITTTYTLTGTDVNGCTKTVPVTQLVATCIGIEEQSNLAGMLSIYPNPSHGEFTIHADVSMNVSIVNELGQLVKSFSIGEKENTVNVRDLANGIYFILAEKDGNISTKKMVIEK